MRPGKFKYIIFFFIIAFFSISSTYADDKIESVPLINLEDLSPTFEEEKDELEKAEEKKINLDTSEGLSEENNTTVYKGSFTTCNQEDNKCPPWSIYADEVVHKKK